MFVKRRIGRLKKIQEFIFEVIQHDEKGIEGGGGGKKEKGKKE